jgi:hypothetical protein
MKNINTVVGYRKNRSGNCVPAWSLRARRLSGAWKLLLGALPALALAGCTLRQSYPETEIRGYINGEPFAVHAPKDSTLTGFDAIAETNGSVHVHIDSLQCSLNPTNLTAAASGQAAIVTALGQALNQAVQTGGAMALKAATAP